ncbi:MAG: hypothetical protein HYY10_00075 [Candidatus Liptonbacteria bacterium]|nr:hypothetical protein [Candidatus Liptonbacteria bacterium]
MAIIIEEEQQNPTSTITVIVWVVIVGVVGVATYYLFFKNPELISFPTPESFKSTEALSKIDLDPERLMRSSTFLELKQYVSLPQPTKLGRPNPFLGF